MFIINKSNIPFVHSRIILYKTNKPETNHQSTSIFFDWQYLRKSGRNVPPLQLVSVGVQCFSNIMARRKESDRAQQNNDDSDSNPNDELDEEPNFDDPEEYEDDISEQGTIYN